MAIIRCTGNTTMTNSRDGAITVHLSLCNVTSPSNNSVKANVQYDSPGALKFTVTIVMVYGIAVVGVFALTLLNRKKRNKEVEYDKEAQIFMKDYDNVKHNFEQQSRVGAVSSLLHHIHRQPSESPTAIQGAGLLNNLAFLALPLSKITEENDTEMAEVNMIDETSSGLPSSVVIEEEPGPTCVFCDVPLDTDNDVGPLCQPCVNKYKDSIDPVEIGNVFEDTSSSSTTGNTCEGSDNACGIKHTSTFESNDSASNIGYRYNGADNAYEFGNGNYVPLSQTEDIYLEDYVDNKRRNGIPYSPSEGFTCSSEVGEDLYAPGEVTHVSSSEEEEFFDVINEIKPYKPINTRAHIWKKY